MWKLCCRRIAFQKEMEVELGRVPDAKPASAESNPMSEYFARKATDMHVPGRVMLNTWRLVQREVTLTRYDFHFVMNHVLHRRLPWYSEQQVCE